TVVATTGRMERLNGSAKPAEASRYEASSTAATTRVDAALGCRRITRPVRLRLDRPESVRHRGRRPVRNQRTVGGGTGEGHVHGRAASGVRCQGCGANLCGGTERAICATS